MKVEFLGYFSGIFYTKSHIADAYRLIIGKYFLSFSSPFFKTKFERSFINGLVSDAGREKNLNYQILEVEYPAVFEDIHR